MYVGFRLEAGFVSLFPLFCFGFLEPRHTFCKLWTSPSYLIYFFVVFTYPKKKKKKIKKGAGILWCLGIIVVNEDKTHTMHLWYFL